MKPAPHDPQAGVALLELMVGLVLLSLLVVMLSQAQFFVLGAWSKGAEDLRQRRDVAQCQQVLLRQLRSAVPFKPPKAYRRMPTFWGSGQELTFVTSQPAAEDGSPGLYLVTYSLAQSGNQPGALMVQTRPALDRGYWNGDPSPVEGLALLDGVTGIKFSYLKWDWRRKQSQTLSSWQTTGSGSLPLAVELSIDLNGEKMLWYLPLACGKG